MPDDDVALSDLLTRIQFLLAEPLDFARTDSEATALKVRLLTAAAAYFNILAVSDFGGRAGPTRDEGLVEQIVAAAFQTFGGHDPHPGHSSPLPEDDVVSLCLRVSAGEIRDLETIAANFRRLWTD